jgi:hypothetical protein
VICLVIRGLGGIAPSQEPPDWFESNNCHLTGTPYLQGIQRTNAFMHPAAFLLDVGDMVVNGAKIESWSVLVYLLLSQLGMPPQR